MTVAVTGASGLIGSTLVDELRAAGRPVRTLVRRPPTGPDEIEWHPERGQLDPASLAGIDQVVHLAGAGINGKRWTDDYKRQVKSSRVDGTRTISAAIAAATAADGQSRTLASGSAIGYYGNRGDTELLEHDSSGDGYLAEVCREWEASTEGAEEAGARVAHLRTGLVLDRNDGLLAPLRRVFALGIGGKLGPGTQWQSWISLADEVAAIRFILDNDTISGAVNLTGPAPVRQVEFAKTLGKVMHRPALFPVPGIAMRIVLGEFADEGVLFSQRVLPKALLDAGFEFQHPTLAAALTDALER